MEARSFFFYEKNHTIVMAAAAILALLIYIPLDNHRPRQYTLFDSMAIHSCLHCCFMVTANQRSLPFSSTNQTLCLEVSFLGLALSPSPTNDHNGLLLLWVQNQSLYIHVVEALYQLTCTISPYLTLFPCCLVCSAKLSFFSASAAI